MKHSLSELTRELLHYAVMRSMLLAMRRRGSGERRLIADTIKVLDIAAELAQQPADHVQDELTNELHELLS